MIRSFLLLAFTLSALSGAARAQTPPADATPNLAQLQQELDQAKAARAENARLAKDLAAPAQAAPDIDGMWNVTMSCPSGSSVNEPYANFRHGHYARTFSTATSSGETSLTMSFTSANTVHLQGHIHFDGVGDYPVNATATLTASQSYSGTGRFGSEYDFTMTALRTD